MGRHLHTQGTHPAGSQRWVHSRRHPQVPHKINRRIHRPVVCKRVLRASWQPVKEPAETANIPMGMKEAFGDARQKAGCINLAKDNHVRLDQSKTNLDRLGYWPALQDKETSALLLEPGLARAYTSTRWKLSTLIKTLWQLALINLHGHMPNLRATRQWLTYTAIWANSRHHDTGQIANLI